MFQSSHANRIRVSPSSRQHQRNRESIWWWRIWEMDSKSHSFSDLLKSITEIWWSWLRERECLAFSVTFHDLLPRVSWTSRKEDTQEISVIIICTILFFSWMKEWMTHGCNSAIIHSKIKCSEKGKTCSLSYNSLFLWYILSTQVSFSRICLNDSDSSQTMIEGMQAVMTSDSLPSSGKESQRGTLKYSVRK